MSHYKFSSKQEWTEYHNFKAFIQTIMLIAAVQLGITGCSSIESKYTGRDYLLTVHTSESEPLFSIHANKNEITEVHYGSLVINEKFVRAAIRTSIKHHQEFENNQWYDVGTLTITTSCKDGSDAITARVQLQTECTLELIATKPMVVDFKIRLSDGYGVPKLPFGIMMKLEPR